METLSQCPVCSSSQFKPFISCEDYTVSHETFQIIQCEGCGFKFTNPRPTEESIGKYYQSTDYISHSNVSKGLINSIYQVVRQFTISKKIKLIKSISKEGKNILDYGSGTGEFLYAIKKSGWNAKGAEPNSDARNYAINNHLLEVVEPAEIRFFPKGSFDIITLWHVLEHIHKLNEIIDELKKMLAINGKIIVAVPNNKAAEQLIYGQSWAAYDVPRHLYHFNLDSIKQLFENHQMKVEKFMTMPFDAFYVSILSEKYKESNLGFIKGFFNGTRTLIKSFFDKQKSSSLIFIIGKV
ncbi:MAG TPA: class I SAM-dependent methyltransferase [Bacteroidia bacterium]|nr:class I SAM-dependent methyltransferase [Bacteroidia bacterium]